MKKKALFAGTLTVLLVFGLVLAGCDTDSGSKKGTLTIHNSSTYDTDAIILVEVYRGTSISSYDVPAVKYNVPIPRGQKYSCELDPGAYMLFVVDNHGLDYEHFVSIEKGKTTNVTFHGDGLF